MKNRAAVSVLLLLGILLAQFTLLLPVYVSPFRRDILSEEFCFTAGGVGFLILLILFITSFRHNAQSKILIRAVFISLAALLLFEIWYVRHQSMMVEESIEQIINQLEYERQTDSLRTVDSFPDKSLEKPELDYGY
jgi:hypothetical protein